MAATLAAAVAVSRYTIRILTRPLEDLEEAVRGVRVGKLAPVAVTATHDEMESLASSINHLVHDLATKRQSNPEDLERRIRQRTEALEEATSRALAASRAKSEFLANMSHELRTPMSGILGMIDLAMTGPLASDQRDQLETAKVCAHSLLAILNDILDLSKIEAGKMLLEKAPFDPREVARQTARSFAAECASKGIEMRENLDVPLPPQLLGDPLRVRQILTNLLSNAVKFTSVGYVEISADYRPDATPESGGSVIFRVSDSGTGIPAEKLNAIFDEFTQADGSVSRRFGGTGLGLAITRRLVELHKGQISVTSEEGRGSVFTVDLRFDAAPKPPAAGEPAPNSDAVEQGESAGRKATVLVCEDNTVNQRVMRALLEREGHRVIVAGDGRAALRVLAESAVDVILMDVQMPEMDGITAARLIRERPEWQNVPIVAITAHAMNGDRERCLQAGMTGYVSKPIAPKTLIEAVRNQLAGRYEILSSTNTMAAIAQGLPEPVDRQLAARLMGNDRELMNSMMALFLQLAPERIEKLQIAATRLDTFALRSHAETLGKAAERIAAMEVASRARQLGEGATSLDTESLQEKIKELERALRRLDRHVRKQHRKHELAALKRR
jgi:signal transduction histidine kinase/DNA-binding response OmpR family regulator